MIIDVFATSKAIKTSIASLVISTDCGFLQKLLCILFCFIAVKVNIMYLLATLLSCFYLFSVVAGGVFEYGHYFSDSSHLP
jgi:hypothetical protein